ncbi:stealth family protein [Flavobacteriaceae bacterium]|jgi:hypothetical protein|nr:stealth family protein [Flavobacteriaceae bacterium]
MTNNKNFNLTIDAVILWVDGNDEKHKRKISPYILDKKKIKSNKFRTRYDQVNEIKYTIDSILKFAPYINRIHIITDNQIPKFLKNNTKYQDKITVVDHTTIFNGYETYLPTFNCRPIETCMYRIPGLSEHFIYFNDDFFLINPTVPEDFFCEGLPVLRGKWLKFDEHIYYKKFKKPKTGHKTAQQNAAKLIGFKRYYNFKHTPHPLRKSTFLKYFKEHPSHFEKNIKYKFRNDQQFTPQGLANHLEIKNKACVFKSDLQLIYFRSYKKPMLWYIYKLNRQHQKRLFLGLQSLDLCPQEKLTYLLNWIKKRIN